MAEGAERRRVVLGVTGSIAAYKSAELARLLVTKGFDVRCVMSDAAREFITPLTLRSVTDNPVMTSFWEDGKGHEIEHVALADWADAVVVAPATADFIARSVAGFADTPLLAVLLATRAPVVMAPAMNVNMYSNPSTIANVRQVRSRGVTVVDPGEGALACGWNGTGRLADPALIFQYVRRALTDHDYAGRRVLVVTGPTREPIDPVRFLSNRSSGKMGLAVAAEAFRRGADVTVVHGPISQPVPEYVKRVSVVTAAEMREAALAHAFDGDGADLVVMAAAVSDFRPVEQRKAKIKKAEGGLATLELEGNPDILGEIGARKATRPGQKLVGFAVETGELEDLLDELRRKLKDKSADLMVGNFAQDAFDLDTNRVWLVDRHGKQEDVAPGLKERVAAKILDAARKV